MVVRASPGRGGPLTIVLLACAGLLLAVAGVVFRGPALPVASGSAAAVPSVATVPPREPTPSIPAAPASPAAVAPRVVDGEDPRTVRSFLAEYYGQRWPETARAIEGAGLDLDQPYVFTPWEQVEDQFAISFGLDKESERVSAGWAVRSWPEELSARWLADRFGLEADSIAPDDLAAVEALAAEHNLLLEATAEEWVAGIEQHLAERWAAGEYFRAPFTTLGLYTEQGFFTTATAGHGWAVVAVLKREEYPDMVAIEHRATELRDARDELIARYLHEQR